MTTTTKSSGKKATYKRHSSEYKAEALKLAADLDSVVISYVKIIQMFTIK